MNDIKTNVLKNQTLQKLFLILETLYGIWVMQPSALQRVDWEGGNIFKHIFNIFAKINGWGIENIFFFLGMLCIFYFADKMPQTGKKNPWLKALCALFAFGTVIGKSYFEAHSWFYFWPGKKQLFLALFCCFGYYLVYKNIILFCHFLVQNRQWMQAKECRNKAERFLFEAHPFGGPLLVMCILAVPYLIAFFPGTLHWDALGQLWAYLEEIEWTGIHPLFNTYAMGGCLVFGRTVFGSDNIGFFFYTFPQYIMQWLVFSYGMYLLGKMKSPLFIRWGALAYFTIFPTWRMWGYTMAKDTYYYIFLLLLVLVLIDICIKRYDKITWWQWLLLALSPACACLSKGNGLFVMICTFIGALIFWRKQWKLWLLCLATAIIPISLQNYVVMPAIYDGITQGPVGETMSIPMQQTARYLLLHGDEVTPDEAAVLDELFMCPLSEIPRVYQYETSDPVKGNFILYPTSEQLSSYYKVWFAQLCKHPATYLQAFINQTYGFFTPNRSMFNDTTARYGIGIDQEKDIGWDQGMNVHFGIENSIFRDVAKDWADVFLRLPVLGMLYSAGFQNYILLGCFTYLCAKKKWKELALLFPAIFVTTFNLFSPVNAYMRYMLPVMAMQPFLIAWCYYVTHTEEKEDESRDTLL